MEQARAARAAQEVHDCPENPGQKRTIQDTGTKNPNSGSIAKRKREPELSDGNALAESPVAFWAREGLWPPKYKRRDRQHILAREYPTEPMVLNSHGEDMSNAQDSNETGNAGNAEGAGIAEGLEDAEDVEDEEDAESDCWAHEEKITLYEKLEWKLDKERSFICDSFLGADPKITELCQKWLEEPQEHPDGLEPGVDFFESLEQDKTELEAAEMFSSHMKPYEGVQILSTSFYRGWNNSVPLTEMRPQPDLTVGFALCEFTQDQLKRLLPFIGRDATNYLSFFMATDKICFPFLTYELDDISLDNAELLNAHNMTLAVRGVVELFRLVNRQHELHRQILAFSLSHDCTSVQIYGHYAEIKGKLTTYYHHPIHSYRFEHEEEEGKWAAHRFVKNVYDKWVPDHYERICSAINQLPMLGSDPEAIFNHKWDPMSQLPDALAHLETE
ncbi:hypothetical protein TGAM01_v202501 [Trichoderma gamsii]|uniref:DUF7924 domain-containing protein n=1 Tax=Trichoderma gamsii TaxID=398673 RepID=A0A2P4ZWH3_9HYPO|nr:hypothetical protein TGAM01_v202501 [Trichoderma gamsii]PON28654.1 hypothetical protein TGAM01_v202501 [Trichoderma gamsii]